MFKEEDFLHRKAEGEKTLEELLKIEKDQKNVKEPEKFLSPTLLELKSEENAANIDMMLNDLANFKHERNENLSKNIKVSSSNDIVFNHLEKYLLEICYVKDKEKREEEIKKLYEWYEGRRKFEKDIKTITYKTYKERNEVDASDFFLNRQFSTCDKDDTEIAHRNLDLINKKMLNEYERKKLSKPFWALRKAISSQTLSSQGSVLSSTTNFTGSNLEKPDFSSIYTLNKGTNVPTKKHYTNEIFSYIDKPVGGLLEKNYISQDPQNYIENILIPPANKETKFSYSYLRPIYDLNNIYLENKIIEEKNKLIALKRNKEEINAKLKEFSYFRAKYKESLNNKYEMKNLLNIYVNQHDFSSDKLKKYKIKIREKEKEKMESIEARNSNVSEIKNVESSEFNNRKSLINLNLNLRKNYQSEKVLDNKIKEENSNVSNIKSEYSEKSDAKLKSNPSSYKKIISALTPKISLFELSDEKNKDKDEGTGSFIKSFKLSLTKKLTVRKSKKSLKRRKSSLLSKLFPLKTFSGNNEKIKTGEVQNLEKQSNILKISDNREIKEYKIKFPQEKADTELINKNKKENNSDALPKLLSNETLNKEKLLYKHLCKINTNISNNSYIDSDINQRTKWIMLNKSNIDQVNKDLLDKMKKRNQFIKLNNRYNNFRNDFLAMRQSLSVDKKIQYQNLVDKIKLKRYNDFEFNDENDNDNTELENNKSNPIVNYKFVKRSNKNTYSILHALINPKDNSNYSKFYLPRNGSLLLSRERHKKYLG